ncbi:MAG: iron-sulfur cluster assembly scaffold protein [Novosphingobium sp.]
MASAGALYTPEVLGLATALAHYPLTDDLLLRGNARSASCGSALELGLAVADERIVRVGLRSHACAIGQAAAAIFAVAAGGRTRAEIAEAESQIGAWLTGGPTPAWPGMEAIARAVAYPARHGAVLLPWRAALSALPSAAARG